MASRDGARLELGFQHVARASALAAVAIGGLVLIGWTFNVEFLRSVVPGLTAMNPAVAIYTIACGVALLLAGDSARQTRALQVGRALAAFVALMALARLAGYLFTLRIGFLDQLLFRAKLDAYDPPNRMAPNAALAFLFVSSALVLLDVETRRSRRPAQGLAILGTLLALLTLLGYAFHTPSFTRISGAYIPMSLVTGLALAILGNGILSARPRHGLMAVVTSDGPGGLMARRLLPAAVGIPFALGYLWRLGHLADLYDPVFGLSLFVMSIIVTLSTLIWWSAASIRRTDKRRRRAEEELVHERDLLHTLMDNVPDAIYFKDAESRFTLINRSLSRTFGLDHPDEAVGTKDSAFFGAEHADVAENDEREVIRTGRPLVAKEERETWADGRETWASTTKMPLRDKEGRIIGTFGISRDITLSKQAHLVLEQARQAADQANRAKSTFLANMSHEIRTPMNAVIGLTELLLGTDLRPLQREYLAIVKDSAESLLALINDILDFSKIEADKLELDHTPFQLREVLGDTMKGLALRARGKELEVACRVHPTVPDAFEGDPYRLRQIVTNLVGNAIKFTERGEVVLTVEQTSSSEQESELDFSVRDTGLGIPIEKQRVIFEAFSQVDSSTTRRFGGTGLGLAISARLVAMMGGRIWVESNPGTGSTFHFVLKLSRRAKTAPAPRATLESLNGLPVLVVDDNATNRLILHEMIGSWGMRPTAVPDGDSALAVLRQARQSGAPFRLVLSDVHMPGMDGFELTEKIKSSSDLSGTVILMLTSGAGAGDIERCHQAGGAAHLMKPIKQSELFDLIVAALGVVEQAESTPTASVAATGEIRPLHLLLAEDSYANQRLAVGVLSKWGHTVTVVNNGRQAVDEVEKNTFDLVLMDVQMPEMDGLRATAVIREREGRVGGHVPIVAMTAHAMKGDREECLSAGMDGYVSKPIRRADLQKVMEEVMQARPSLAERGASAS